MLDFKLVDGGRSAEVTVTADGSEPAIQRACVTAIQAALEVKIRRALSLSAMSAFPLPCETSVRAGPRMVLRVQFNPATAIEPIIENDWTRLTTAVLPCS